MLMKIRVWLYLISCSPVQSGLVLQHHTVLKHTRFECSFKSLHLTLQHSAPMPGGQNKTNIQNMKK